MDGGSAISVFNLFQSFTVSHYVFIHTGKILPSFCFLMLNSPSSLSLLPYDRGSTSVAFHSAHSSMSSAGEPSIELSIPEVKRNVAVLVSSRMCRKDGIASGFVIEVFLQIAT